jgi:hypothetical protein
MVLKDDDTYSPGRLRQPEPGRLPPYKQEESVPEQILICGWRRDIDTILRLLEFRMAQVRGTREPQSTE